MPYAKQQIGGRENNFICGLVCCNGKVYAIGSRNHCLILVDIQGSKHNSKNNGQVVISLSTLGLLPCCFHHVFNAYLIGYCNEMFTILVSKGSQSEKLHSLQLYKLDFSAMMWEEMKSAKGRVFFLVEDGSSQICCPAIHESKLGSGTGSYIHLIGDQCKLYSYSMEDKSFSLSSFPCPDLSPGLWPQHTLAWLLPEKRLADEHIKAKGRSDTEDEQEMGEEIVVKSITSSEVDRMMNEQLGEKMIATTEGRLLDIPFHVLELIAEHCVAVDYLNFRATCKRCRLAAPLTQTRTLLSPWLMVFDQHADVITFTDPKFGDKYLMTIFPELVGDVVICASKFGWLLIFRGHSRCPVFFNPFTRVIIELPRLDLPLHCFSSFAFSAPPTLSTCIVAAFEIDCGETIHISFPEESEWCKIKIGDDIPYNLASHISPIFWGQNLYVLCRRWRTRNLKE